MDNPTGHGSENSGEPQHGGVAPPSQPQAPAAPAPPSPPISQSLSQLPPPQYDQFSPMRTAKPAAKLRWPGQVEFKGAAYAPAGFWLRAVAFMIDLVLLSLLHIILVEIAQVPKVDLEAMLVVVESLFEELINTGFPSDQTLAALDELQRPAVFSGWLRVAMCALYFTLFHGLQGQTLGKLCVGIRVLRKDGQALSLGWAALRYLGYFLTSRLLHTAWVLPFDPQRRTLYDMALGTNVYREISGKK